MHVCTLWVDKPHDVEKRQRKLLTFLAKSHFRRRLFAQITLRFSNFKHRYECETQKDSFLCYNKESSNGIM